MGLPQNHQEKLAAGLRERHARLARARVVLGDTERQVLLSTVTALAVRTDLSPLAIAARAREVAEETILAMTANVDWSAP
jgi:hypothetical protein